MPTRAPIFSVVIPTYGRPALAAKATLSALEQRLPGGSFEVIVVDDGGADPTREVLLALPGLRLRPGKGALLGSVRAVPLSYFRISHAGPATARNHGARLARGRWLAFLDSDTVALPGWLAAAHQCLKRTQGPFGVEGCVLPDIERPATPFTESIENRHGGRWLTCNLFVDRKAFLSLGGFDERFTEPCREDSEFAFRALEAGHRFEFEPAAVVKHPVREVGLGRFFYHAREGRFEALIERAHPRLYREHFKWLDGRALPAYYFAHYLALPVAWLNMKFGLGLLGVGTVAVLYAWSRKRHWPGLKALGLPLLAILAPYARLFWVAIGYLWFVQNPKNL